MLTCEKILYGPRVKERNQLGGYCNNPIKTDCGLNSSVSSGGLRHGQILDVVGRWSQQELLTERMWYERMQ